MIEEIVTQIMKDFPGDKVAEMLDDEILNWVEDGWDEEYESEYEWYTDFGHGEAEDVIIKGMIDNWKEKYKKDFDDNTYVAIFESIKQGYDELNYL